MADRIQFRRGTEARWATVDPILMEGEIGYVSDKPNQHKMGDGISRWSELPYRGFDGTLVHEAGDSTTAVMSQKAVTDYIDRLGIFESGNDEFIYSLVDSENKLLYGIRLDGTVYSCDTDDKTKEALLKSKEDFLSRLASFSEYVKASLVLKVDKVEGKDLVDEELISAVSSISIISNEEFIYAVVDSESTILIGLRRDGTQYTSDIDDKTKEVLYSIKSSFIELDSLILALDNSKVDKIDGKSLIDENVAKSKSIEDNGEFMEVTTDESGNILSSRNKKGVKKETILEVDDLTMPQKEAIKVFNQAISDDTTRLAFEQKMLDDGFAIPNALDLSNAEKIEIPTPRCALINFTATNLPTAKSDRGTVGVTCDIPTIMEFWDMQGNYFKKWILNSAQGNSSMSYPKKNFSFDIFNGEIEDDNSASLKFGNWVSQDSFHLKAYYTDFFRGIGTVAYKVYDAMMAKRGIYKDRVWKEQFITPNDANYGHYEGRFNDILLQINSEARCYPDGFPCIVYFNGEFYGIYAFQLKKHRNNMMQIKTGKHIHLDGTISSSTLFGGNINWTSFEVRNPKGIRNHIDGTKYDGNYPKEVMGADSEFFIPGSTNYERSAEVKDYIINLSNYAGELNSLISLKATYGVLSNEWTTAININEDINEKPLILYKRSSTEPVKPSNSSVWDFTTDNWNVEPDNGWSLEKPDGEEPCWVTTATAVSTNNSANIPATMWSAIREITDDVYNTEVVSLYIRAAGETPPTYSYTIPRIYDFATGILSENLKGWTQRVPADDGNTCWVIKATVFEKGTTRKDVRTRFAEMFDVDSMVDYFVFMMLFRNRDAFNKNWQWTTYDGVKWYVNPYDLDGILGAGWRGNSIGKPDTETLNIAISENLPTSYLYLYFTSEIEAAWAKFRNEGIFNEDFIIAKLNEWTAAIGSANFSLEYSKWNESPCNRDRNQNTDNWEYVPAQIESVWSSTTAYALNAKIIRSGRCYNSLSAGNVGNDPLTSPTFWKDVSYDETKLYSVNNICFQGQSVMYQFKCIADCVGIPPISSFYSMFPYELGHRDNIYRVYQYIKDMITLFDNKFNFY